MDFSDRSDPCFICGASNWKPLYETRDFLHDIEGTFWLVECSHCKLVTVLPRLPIEELDKYYPEEYIAYPSAVEEETEWHKRADRMRGIRRRCDFSISESGKSTGTILDIGSATGIYLKAMQDRGWQATGLEPSEYAAHYAINHLKLNVIHGYLEQDTFPANQFDLITLWDVFEHLPNPTESLEIIHKILKPGGVLLLTLPNSNSWDRHFFKKAWAGWDAPRHFFIYNESCLTQLLKSHSFRFKRLKSFTNRHGSMVYSVRFWLKSKQVPEKKRETIERFLNSYFFRALSYPYFLFADAINRSASMTLTYVKE